MAQMTVRIDDNLKVQAEMLFAEIGMPLSTAVTIALVAWLLHGSRFQPNGLTARGELALLLSQIGLMRCADMSEKGLGSAAGKPFLGHVCVGAAGRGRDRCTVRPP